MAIERFEISEAEGIELRPTDESRAQLAAIGITDVDDQDACYKVLAEGLAAAEQARRVEGLATTALQARYTDKGQGDQGRE